MAQSSPTCGVPSKKTPTSLKNEGGRNEDALALVKGACKLPLFSSKRLQVMPHVRGLAEERRILKAIAFPQWVDFLNWNLRKKESFEGSHPSRDHVAWKRVSDYQIIVFLYSLTFFHQEINAAWSWPVVLGRAVLSKVDEDVCFGLRFFLV